MFSAQYKDSHQFIKHARECYRYHIAESLRFKAIIDSNGGLIPVSEHGSHNKTFVENILAILSDDIARKTDELLLDYQIRTGIEIDKHGFVARLSKASKSNPFKCHRIKESKIRGYWWVLDKWVENDKIKEDYMIRIRDK